MTPLPKLIVVLGPTAVGKSDTAVDLALEHDGEIVSADSRQVYRGLDIGSGKITKKEMRGVPHHCLDLVSPRSKVFTVSNFQKYASIAIADILSRGKVPILCGGTGFYIDSVVDGIVLPDVDPNPELRKRLTAYSTEKLEATSRKLDPDRLAQIDPKNRLRVIRSIEIAKALGKVPAIEKRNDYDVLTIGLDTDDAILKERIYRRILARIKKGMIREAERVHESGVPWKRMRELGLEYGLLANLLQKKMTREQFVERLNYDIWHYVRRQRAWFKRDQRTKWFDPKDAEKIEGAVKGFLALTSSQNV